MNGRILIIDDDDELRTVLKNFFEAKQLQVHLATTGEEGLVAVRILRPHLVLLDLHLPGMDGIETLKRIRELDVAVGVLIMTGFEDQESGRMALELGASDYIRKPIDFKYLEASVLQKIQSMIGTRE
jgi:DNA-binding response OmpR family regulator